MPRQSDARDRMIRTAAVLFREHGVQGTSFADVVERSGAPRGSIYHHFQGGKTELAEEATRWAGQYIVASTAAALEEDDPVQAIRLLHADWAGQLRRTDFDAGCAIVAGALEGAREPAVRAAADEAFAAWEKVLADAFRRRGIPAARARSIATLLIAAIEGAVVLARARRSTTPLERVGKELETVVALALAESG
ncbi:MAG TPA: TetR/AcrR family transcriptional regulator [Solirubrobacteraceae bacterium]